MKRLKYPQKRIAHCQKCKKRTAWLYIGGARTFWLCLLCGTREEAQMREPSDPSTRMRTQIEETTAAARETVARAHAAFDQTRQRLQELDELRQLHRAITERKAEQQLHPHSEQIPAPQESDAPPEPAPAVEPSPHTQEAE
jgi:hypothetical protein